MKKKRFYNNKKRNTKWTEKETGRKIYFADKYIDGGETESKYDGRAKKRRTPFFTKDKMRTVLKYCIVTVCSFAVISTGYAVMDLYIERNAMPEVRAGDELAGGVGSIDIDIRCSRVQSISLDGGVMLNSVVNDTLAGGYTGVAFDVKRNDGTIGYNSSLATIDMYGAKSSNASDIEASVKRFVENDIMPVGIISCYKDNVLTAAEDNSAVKINGEIYRDEGSNAYLNPDSDITYSYIKSIIEEVSGYGVKVFVLTDCDLPEKVKTGYNDGFDALSQRLYKDLGDSVKLVKGAGVSISAVKVKAIEKEWAEKTEKMSLESCVVCINAKSPERVKNILDSKGKVNYIIAQ